MVLEKVLRYGCPNCVTYFIAVCDAAICLYKTAECFKEGGQNYKHLQHVSSERYTPDLITRNSAIADKPRDAFRGQSKSPNKVSFYMLGMVSY